MNNLETEIAELQKMIEAKRDQLEKEGGIVEEKELVRESVREMFTDAVTPTSTVPANNTAHTTDAQIPVSVGAEAMPVGGSYLDYLDPQTTEMINAKVAEIPTKGIVAVINEVAGQEPFVIDAFHDALVDKLYDELKARGLVK
jgi:hypothetical protein